MNESLVFGGSSEAAAQAIVKALQQHGFNVIRSFDLRSALTTHIDCECPHHGTAQCTCQFIVLLVYGDSAEPVVVTAHSRDAQTEVRIVRDSASQPDPPLAGQVMAGLVQAALTLRVLPAAAVASDAGPA